MNYKEEEEIRRLFIFSKDCTRLVIESCMSQSIRIEKREDDKDENNFIIRKVRSQQKIERVRL